jgi:hypothetical protein
MNAPVKSDLPRGAIWSFYWLLWVGGLVAFNIWAAGFKPTGEDAHHFPEVWAILNVYLVISMLVSAIVLAILVHLIGRKLRRSSSAGGGSPDAAAT